jgi:hypothetical protein
MNIRARADEISWWHALTHANCPWCLRVLIRIDCRVPYIPSEFYNPGRIFQFDWRDAAGPRLLWSVEQCPLCGHASDADQFVALRRATPTEEDWQNLQHAVDMGWIRVREPESVACLSETGN